MFERSIIKWYPVNSETANDIPIDVELLFVAEVGDSHTIYQGKLLPSAWYGYCSEGLCKIHLPVTHFALIPYSPSEQPKVIYTGPQKLGGPVLGEMVDAKPVSVELGAYMCLQGMLSKGTIGGAKNAAIDALSFARELDNLLRGQ